ncbi:unnamed protein product [Orchesella dallaii]|uniref:DOMON domain-containing protein n=1 Tax=Orchesella dallaii TaxID=48710 RepID=A0ABP1PK96_9HEXA
MLRLIFRFTLLWAVAEAIFNVRLGEDITLYWELDYGTGEFVAEIHAKDVDPSTGWVGLGFSSRGNISDGSGDFCITWRDQLGAAASVSAGEKEPPMQITDVHIRNGTNIIEVDQQQDCLDFQFLFQNGTLKWTFRRKFTTCDYFDYALEEGTTHLHWVKGTGPLYDIKGVSIKKALDHGFKRIRFLKNIESPEHKQERINNLRDGSSWNFRILNTQVKVPAVETTYWCQIFKIPEGITKKKHHVIQFGSFIQKGSEDLVHHMEVFHCSVDPHKSIPMYAGPCDESPPELSVCSRVIGAWAMGAEPLSYPADAGLAIGGPDFNPYVRLEMHYNNPGKRADYVDSSGMEFWVTDKLRAHDAGVIELGLEYSDKMAIPPKQTRFQLTGVCNRECTSVSFPRDGITIFASQLHTHLTGARVVTRHFRPSLRPGNVDGFIELPFMNWDNHYSTHYQEIRPLKRPTRVLPGDILLTTCEFNTMDRTNATLGGFAISEEMCVNYFHYYPRTKLEVCKSSVAWKSLRQYFHFMQEMEGQQIEPEGAVSSNYNGIEWTPFRAKLLSDFYNKSPIDMQCNQSDGTRFPGSWDSMPVPKFSKLLQARNPNDECYL